LNGPHQQRGVALVVALLAVALALVLIASLLDRGELAFAKTRNALRNEQAIAYAEGLESFAAQVLSRDRDQNPGLDTLSDVWSVPLPPQDVPGGQISARLRDLNGCFNLNNLLVESVRAAVWRRRLENLLLVLELDPSLAGAIVDWLDADTGIDPAGGAEDSAYLAEAIPYRAANRAFAHISELRLVRGVSGEVYARLAPEVCALPPGTSLNLNTASTALLMSLDRRMTEALALRIRQDGQAQWASVADALNEARQQGVELAPTDFDTLGVTSSYFLARAEITLDEVPFTFSSLLERALGGDGRGGVHVLQRSRGVEDAINPTLSAAPDRQRRR
jgi:general secretion pathway protein K